MATPAIVLKTSKAPANVVGTSMGGVALKMITTRAIFTATSTRSVRNVACNTICVPYSGYFKRHSGSNATLSAHNMMALVQPAAGLKIIGWSCYAGSNPPSGTGQLKKVTPAGVSSNVGTTSAMTYWSEKRFTGETVAEGDLYYLYISGGWTTNLSTPMYLNLYFE